MPGERSYSNVARLSRARNGVDARPSVARRLSVVSWWWGGGGGDGGREFLASTLSDRPGFYCLPSRARCSSPAQRAGIDRGLCDPRPARHRFHRLGTPIARDHAPAPYSPSAGAAPGVCAIQQSGVDAALVAVAALGLRGRARPDGERVVSGGSRFPVSVAGAQHVRAAARTHRLGVAERPAQPRTSHLPAAAFRHRGRRGEPQRRHGHRDGTVGGVRLARLGFSSPPQRRLGRRLCARHPACRPGTLPRVCGATRRP
eukprot:ctg_757.g354